MRCQGETPTAPVLPPRFQPSQPKRLLRRSRLRGTCRFLGAAVARPRLNPLAHLAVHDVQYLYLASGAAVVLVAWSSAAGHVAGRTDAMVKGNPLAEEIGDWRRWLLKPQDGATLETLRRHGRTGRPLGGPRFLERIEPLLGRRVRKGKPGPKPEKDRRN